MIATFNQLQARCLELIISLIEQEAQEVNAHQVLLRRGTEKSRQQELYVEWTPRGLQKIKEETKYIGVVPFGGGSHGSSYYGSRSHESGIVNNQVRFFHEQRGEVSMPLPKTSPHAPFDWLAPAVI